ncbi:HU family DNA-binding protein [Methylocapsa acidiphila]|uniref:HU family DNA-binding protein n=1 Tax=Methylocapsa acidiphila TaxID=133552 RepID=UPI00047C4859|nr:HU family DNA-binding protein [Methylocapsa acidiphila]
MKAATAKSPAPRAAAPQATVTLKQIGVQLAESHELPKRQVDALLDDMIAAVTKHIKKGSKVRLSGLGILQVKKRAARTGRNPATGEAIKIKASKKVAFRVARDLKAVL